MHGFNNEQDRFGSARFATEEEIERAGLFDWTPNSAFLGFVGQRPIYGNGPAGQVLVSGARGGKLTDIVGYLACGGNYAHSTVYLDPKGEIAAISQNQTHTGKHTFHWNPRGLHGLPMPRMNPVDYIRIDSDSLVSDVKVFCENMIGLTGSPNAEYFERRAREFLEAVALTVTRLDGVLTLPRLYHFINLMPTGNDAWIEFAFEMSESGFATVARIEEEIAQARGREGSGMQGVMGELFKSVACLSDPVLMDSLSPPYDFSMADLCKSDQAYNLYLMPPAEFIDAWAPVIKAIFVAGMVYKSRAPQAPPQTWVIDECAALGAFPLVVKLYSYGAGIGIRPWTVWQSTFQMRALGPNAENVITSSAGVQSYFTIRDVTSAETISKMLGAQTLTYDDEALQARARLAEQEALQSLMRGGDPIEAGLKIAHHKQAASIRTKQRRMLRDPKEVRGTPPGKQYIFVDGLEHAIYADRRPYYDEVSMAGLFHPNPYHPPLDRVRIKTGTGHAWRRVITEPVPPELAHYPQYAGGIWSYIEGFK